MRKYYKFSLKKINHKNHGMCHASNFLRHAIKNGKLVMSCAPSHAFYNHGSDVATLKQLGHIYLILTLRMRMNKRKRRQSSDFIIWTTFQYSSSYDLSYSRCFKFTNHLCSKIWLYIYDLPEIEDEPFS